MVTWYCHPATHPPLTPPQPLLSPQAKWLDQPHSHSPTLLSKYQLALNQIFQHVRREESVSKDSRKVTASLANCCRSDGYLEINKTWNRSGAGQQRSEKEKAWSWNPLWGWQGTKWEQKYAHSKLRPSGLSPRRKGTRQSPSELGHKRKSPLPRDGNQKPRARSLYQTWLVPL